VPNFRQLAATFVPSGTVLNLKIVCSPVPKVPAFRRLNRRTMDGELAMNAQRNFLLVMTLAAAATPASGQEVAPAVGQANGGAQSAASIPDFSGIWSHPSLPGFEPPLSGPGPVVNKSRIRGGPQNGRGNIFQLVGDYTNPILKPRSAEVVRKDGEISLTGVAYPNPANQCWPSGVPFIFWNMGIQMLQQPDKITILYHHDQEFRQVRMNQRHPAQVTPSWHGDSVGHYEGDTLVIDTVGIKVGPFSMVDWYGTPHTQALHVVERYRLLEYEAAKEGLERDAKENFQFPRGADDGPAPDPNYRGKHLQLQFTVEDEGVFTMAWSATITYRRPSDEWAEYICAENRREYYAGKDTSVPTADKPDF
jgi:hypothetical protein